MPAPDVPLASLLQRLAKIEANYKQSVRVLASDHKAKLAQVAAPCTWPAG